MSLLLYSVICVQFPGGLTQSVFSGLVNHWGDAGLDAHVKKVRFNKRCISS
jgi:hypothetical protein